MHSTSNLSPSVLSHTFCTSRVSCILHHMGTGRKASHCTYWVRRGHEMFRIEGALFAHVTNFTKWVCPHRHHQHKAGPGNYLAQIVKAQGGEVTSLTSHK